MPGVVLLAAAIVVNLLRHLTGRATICQTTRAHIPRPIAAALLDAGFAWLRPHLLDGYPSRSKEIR